MRALSCGALALALATSVASPSRAEPSKGARVWLDWTRGPGTDTCITHEAVVREVGQLLERSVFAARQDADRTLRVELTHDSEPSRYSAKMVLLSKTGASLGTREIVIETSECASASEAFVLAISMLADLPRTAEEEHAAAASAPPGASVPSPPPPRSDPWRLQARLGPALALDTSAGAGPGGHASAMVTPPRFWPINVGVLSAVRWSSPSESTRYVLSSTELAATVCLPPYRTAAFDVTGCLGPQATIHAASGRGFAVDRSEVKATVGGTLQVFGRYAIASAFHAFAMLALAATPQQIDVVFVDGGGVPRRVQLVSSATMTASLGIAVDIF